MRMMQGSLLRALCTIIIGVLLIKYREQTVTWLTICIGGLFLLSGVISIVAYWSAKRNPSEVEIYDAEGRLIVSRTPPFPIVGIGSVLLGFILALMPDTFVKWLLYFLAVMLILGAVNQLAALTNVRRFAPVSTAYWVAPSVILLAGIIILVKPTWIASAPLVIIGIFMILYGLAEFFSAVKIYTVRRRMERQQKRNPQQTQNTDSGRLNQQQAIEEVTEAEPMEDNA